MSTFIKSLTFWNRTQSDEELFQIWSKSNKTPEDFNASIIQMKSNAKVILTEISQVKLKTINDLKTLVAFLLKNHPTTTSSIRKNKLVSIIDNFQFIIRLYAITSLDSLVYFAFSNKYDIFSLLVQNLSKSPSLQSIISEVYYKKEIYIDMVNYYLTNDSDRELRVLLPNEVNSGELFKMNSVQPLSDIKKLFKGNYKQNISSLSELWFNIILYFNSSRSISSGLFTKLSKHIPSNIQPIELMSDLFSISNEIEKGDFLSFISQPIEYQFSKLHKIESKDKFIRITNRLLSFVNQNKSIMEGVDLIPYNVIKSLIENKSLYDQIIHFLEVTFKEGLYKQNELKIFILKYLVENYSDDYISSIQLVAILKKIDSSIIKLGKICFEIEQAVKFITVLNKENIAFTLVDLMKTDLIKADTLVTLALEYLMKSSKDFKTNQYNFIDSNIDDINTLIDYINSHNPSKEKYTIGSLLTLFVDFYPLMTKHLLNVIALNKALKLSTEEMKELIQKFIPIAGDVKNAKSISNFLPLIANDKDYKAVHNELSSILDYISIKEVFNKYQISTASLSEEAEGHRSIQPDQILEIYLIKTFNVDQISSIEDFIQKRPVKDIQNALRLNQSDFLYLLFSFFYKFKREVLYTQVLDLIKTKHDDNNLLMDCIKIIKRAVSKDDFVKFIEKNNLTTHLIENSKYFSLFYNQNKFDNSKHSIKFSTSKDNLDLLSILSIERLDLAPKASKASKQNQLITEDYTKEREVIEEFYSEKGSEGGGLIRKCNNNDRTLNDLIKLYDDKKIQSENEVNYKYSLHPKLLELLNKQDYSYLIKNVKIDFGSKIKLYKFLIINDIIAIDHVFLYENLQKNKISSIDSIKVLFNLYNNQTLNQIDTFIQRVNLSFGEPNQMQTLLNQLIQVNLTTIKGFTYYNLIFLSKYLSFDLESNATLPILAMPLMKIVSDICPKFNLLPFLSNFMSEIYPKNENIINRYYNDYCPMLNLHFFTTQTDYQKKLQYVEIYKSISMNNWINFIKIFNDIGQMEVNVLLIFILKLIYNYTNTSGVMINQAKAGCIYLMNIFNAFRLSVEEIKVVLNDLYSYPQLTAILEGNQNILMLNQKVYKNIKCFSSSKLLLANEVLNLYPKIKDYPIFVHKNKLFQIKNCIIRLIPPNETKDVYVTIREMNDYNELHHAVKDYPKIQKEIYNIYTLNN